MQLGNLKKAVAKFSELALFDDLTGLYDRREFIVGTDHLMKL